MIVTDLDQMQDAPPATTPDASAGDLFRAEREAEAVRTDAWSYGLRVRMDVQRDIYDRLPTEAQQRAEDFLVNRGADEASFERFLLDEAGRARSAGDPSWQDIPASSDDIDAEVNRRRRAVIDEADELSGGSFTFSGFLGQMATAATDRTSLALMPLGGGSGSIGRIAAREAGLGMLGEALILPREFEVAEELELEDPNVAFRLLMGATFGGAIGAGLAAAPRAVNYLVAKRRAADQSKPDGTNPIDYRDEVERQRDAIESGNDSPISDGRSNAPLRMADFDFGSGGNASPQTNRVGYVFGRLVERGMEPHVAAGFVGNFMVEAGPTINPSIVGDGGAALGMAQWNDRRPALIAFAQARGKPPTDLDVQIDFLFHELATSEASAAGRIFQATTAQEAAQLVSDLYERPGIPHMPRRVAHASAVFQDYQAGRVPRWNGSAPEPTSQGYLFNSSDQVIAGRTSNVRFADGVTTAPVDFMNALQSNAEYQAARANNPSAFERFEGIQDRKARLLGWLDDLRDQRLSSKDDTLALIDSRISELEIERQAVSGKQAKAIIRERIREAKSDRETVAGADVSRQSQDEEIVRRQLVELDESMRDLAPEIGAAYRDARSSAAARPLGRQASGQEPNTASARPEFRVTQPSGAPRQSFSFDGSRLLQASLLSRAWDAPDIIARAVEAEPGELKALIDALAEAAPEVARLKADIDAGLVSPDMDITPFVLEAARVIMQARDAAGRGGAIAEIIEELLADEDLLLGGLSPLTRALVRKFMPNGRQVKAGKIAQFLKDYADEARKAGRTGGALDPVGPIDVLRGLDPKAFGDLTEAGVVRAGDQSPPVEIEPFVAEAFSDGAASPHAVTGDNHGADQIRSVIEDLRARAEGLDQLPDGRSFDDVLADLDADEALDTAIDLCIPKGGR